MFSKGEVELHTNEPLFGYQVYNKYSGTVIGTSKMTYTPLFIQRFPVIFVNLKCIPNLFK